MNTKKTALFAIVGLIAACGTPPPQTRPPRDPDATLRAPIDRFVVPAATMLIRDPRNGLPGPNVPIDMDQPPFLTKGLGPLGQHIEYYNFDVQSTTPALIYVFFREGETTPLAGQLNVVDVIPGDAGYNDFWRVTRVRVPASYVPNTATSREEIVLDQYPLEDTDMLVNCPIVPVGSTATRRVGGGSTGLFRAWYRNQVVQYFAFTEADLRITASQGVPLAEINVTFNINPGMTGGGPPSGFMIEAGTDQTHNIVEAIPPDPIYSPLWSVTIYDNTDFATSVDLISVEMATVLMAMAANVNCPIVSIMP